MAKAKAKSKPCAKAKCKGKGKGKGKGRGKGEGFGRGTALALQGLARRQAASRKRKEQVLEQMPGPAVEEDPEIAELQEELASQLLDTNVDDGANPDSLALPAEPCVHAPSPREPAPSLEPCADPPSPHTGEGEPRPPAEMLPVHTLCLVVPGSHTRKQQCKHSHPMGPCRIQYPGQGTVEWHRPRPRADQPLRRSLMMLHIVARHRNVLSASMVHT